MCNTSRAETHQRRTQHHPFSRHKRRSGQHRQPKKTMMRPPSKQKAMTIGTDPERDHDLLAFPIRFNSAVNTSENL